MSIKQESKGIQLHLYQFQAYVLEGEIKLKFPCTFYLSWKIDDQIVQKKDTIPSLDNKITFNTTIIIRAEIEYNRQDKTYLEKKSQICVHLNSLSRSNQSRLAGIVTIDLVKCINSKQNQLLKVYNLERCPDKSSSIKLSIKSKYIGQVNKSKLDINNSRIINSVNSSFVSDKYNSGQQQFNRSPSQKISLVSLKDELKKQDTLNKKDSLSNLLQKKRNNAQYTPKKLKSTQSMKIFNDLMKPSNSRVSQSEDQKRQLNDTIQSQIQKKNMVKSTKQQITEFHDSILQQLDRVRLQQEQKNNNLSQSGRRSFDQEKIDKTNGQISKSQYYRLQLELREAKDENEKLKRQLNRTQKQVLNLKSVNYDFNNQNSKQYNDESNQLAKQKGKLDSPRKNKNQEQQILFLKQKVQEYIKERSRLETSKYELENHCQKIQQTLNKTNEQLKIKQKKIKFIEQEKQLMNQQIQLNNLKINSLEKENKEKSKIILDIKSKNQILNNDIQTLNEKILHQDQYIQKITKEHQNLTKSLDEYKQINEEHINFNNQLEEIIKKNSQKEQQLRNNLLMFQNQILKLTHTLNEKEKVIEYFRKPKTNWSSSYSNQDQNKESLSNSSFENQKNIYSIEEKQENQQQSHFGESSEEGNNNPSDQQIIKNKEKVRQLQQKNTQLKITINQLTISKNKNQIQLTQETTKNKQLNNQIEKLQFTLNQYAYRIQNMENQIEKYHEIQQELQRRNEQIMNYNEQLRQQHLKFEQQIIRDDCNNKKFNLFDDVKIFAKQENQKIEVILKETINILKNQETKYLTKQQSNQLKQSLKTIQIPSQKILKVKQVIQNQIRQIVLQLQKVKLKYLNSFSSLPQKKIIIENLRCIESRLYKSQQILLCSIN